MKAILTRSELVSHRNCLKIANPKHKKVAENAQITITVSDKFVVTGLGFCQDLKCKPIQWGTIALPHLVWQKLIENLVPLVKDEEVTIAAENFQIDFGKTRIENPHIIVRRADKLSLGIPTDAKPIDIIKFALEQDFRALRNSVAWRTVLAAVDVVRRQIERASAPIKRYGFTPEEVAELVGQKLELRDLQGFVRMLFPDKR